MGQGGGAGQRKIGVSLCSVKSLTALSLREERGYLSIEAMGTQRQLDLGERGDLASENTKRGDLIL